MQWPQPVEYLEKRKYEDHKVVCYNTNITHEGSLWRAENPVASTLPVFALQLCLIIFFSRVLIFALKPLRQPPIVAEILAGVLMGPSLLGWTDLFSKYIFAWKSLLALETVANLSLVYYIFLVGLELDMAPIVRAGGKSISIALLGILLPIPVGIGLHHLINNSRNKAKMPQATAHGPLFWGISLATTNFPDLSRILSDVKLLHSEIGRTALSAAVITDLCSWVLLVITMSISNVGKYYAVTSTFVFVCMCLFLFRPALKWLIRVSSKDGNYNEFHICFVMTGVVACGLITDACGTHSIVGAFMWGVIMPKGELKDMIMGKVEDLVKSILMPTFFVVTGLRVNCNIISKESDWVLVLLIIFLATSAKIVSTFLVAIFCNMPPREGLTLGSLMNTKGLLALIIISAGRDMQALGRLTFTVMIMSFWVMTALIGPTLAFTYKSIKTSRKSRYRTIQSIKPEAEFRVVACVHSTRNVYGIIHLLGASNPTKQSPLLVFAIHLVELTGRATAMLIVHGQCKASSAKAKVQTDHIINAFDKFENQNNGVTVHSLTAVSPYATMHDDICGIAAEKRVHLIIVPFHKQPTLDGGLEDGNPSLGLVNNSVMANAPCSVAVLVDRGLSATSLTDSNRSNRIQQRFALFFIGGPDDREALAYALRMSEHPGILITVVRFIPGEEVQEMSIMDFPGEENVEILTALARAKKEKVIDNDYIDNFRLQISSNQSIGYAEVVVNNGDETLKAISTLENEFSLYIVGRGRGMVSPLVSGLSEWSDSPELGVLGDALVTSSFATNVSLLVVQQGDVDADEKGERFNDGGFMGEQFGGQEGWQSPIKKNVDGDFDLFVNQKENDKEGEEEDEEKGKDNHYQPNGTKVYHTKSSRL
ncbi:cation/H(+) antiporter 15-like [Cucumis melo var. makuwa]|uniref:Cation/H(+) antiporter 15-like n=2 Tax=Cucumis melo TaxID=3656 RepID=A0A9I9CUS6_CUCME|nr:cation/H(+) antiporter 15-like [Cucumis melo]KAA0034892.1 cation/H(+) antiporter 15-like [Cucumis melo var. makuwa]TYK05445.1 cation/H(+) antiporter 15-like [Cucumis melo var. makuwa]